MEDNGRDVFVECPEKISNKILEEDMCRFMWNIIHDNHYVDEVPNGSVSVGLLYDSKDTKSLQVRFLKNGLIVKCKYIKSTGLFEFEFYELKHVHHCYRIKSEDECWYRLVGDTKDYIEDVNQQNKEYYISQQEKENTKKQKKLERETKKRLKSETKRRTMNRRKSSNGGN